jgi:hypothetical protein
MVIFAAVSSVPVIVTITETLPPHISLGRVATIYAFAISIFGGSTQFILKLADRAHRQSARAGVLLDRAAVMGLVAMSWSRSRPREAADAAGLGGVLHLAVAQREPLEVGRESPLLKHGLFAEQRALKSIWYSMPDSSPMRVMPVEPTSHPRWIHIAEIVERDEAVAQHGQPLHFEEQDPFDVTAISNWDHISNPAAGWPEEPAPESLERFADPRWGLMMSGSYAT